MTARRLDRTALVTGGTDGIGREIAAGLARAGLTVVVVGRDAQKGAQAERELRELTRDRQVHFLRADLGCMRDVRCLAHEVAGRWPSLDLLVLNAGIVLGRREPTDEGIESNFAVNYLGRFVLTGQLLPRLSAAGQPARTARIVIVSGAARGAVQFDDVNLTANFTTLRAVLQCCRANDLFTAELARRLALDGRPITVTCLKVGVVKTKIRRHFPGWMKLLVPLLDPLLGQTPRAAAAAALRLLLAGDLEGVTGALFVKIRKLRQIAPAGLGLTIEECGRLWQLSERMGGSGKRA